MTEKKRLNSIKYHLAVLVRRGKYFVPFGPELPTKWWFGQVIDPRSGKLFTPAGAWEFIAEKLEETGTTISELELDKPPERKAYELQVHTLHGTIYIKVHFGGKGDTVIGRSFHYSGQK